MNPLPRIGRTAARLLAFAALVVLGCPRVVAQNGNATVSATLVDPSVDTGQPAEYHIDVSNGRPDRPPPAPQVANLEINYSGENRSMQFNLGNGFQMQRIVTTTYIYSITTSHAGRFVIPGQQIEVDGTTLRTLPVTLTVLDPGAGGSSAGQTLTAELVVPKTSAYVGEIIPAELHASFGLNVTLRQIDPDPILVGEGFSVQKFARPTIDTQVIEGAQVHVITYKTAVTGVKTGTLAVGPVTIQPVVQMPVRRQRRRNPNDPFNNPFFDNAFDQFSTPPKQVKLTSNSVNVEIKPLPPDKPADFSGAIGEFKLEAEAEPRKAQAGDPVTVRLVLSGRGNFDRIAAPVLADEHGLRTYPATSKFKADDEVNLSGIKTFEQIVIADGPRSALPSYHLSYLDPTTGKYVSIDTPPIPVEIVGGNTPLPTPASATAPVAPTPTAASTPSRPPKPAEDILYIRPDFGPARTAADFLPAYRRRSFWLAQAAVGLMAIILAAALAFRVRARSGKARRLAQLHRQQAELQRALQKENPGRGEFYAAATQWARLKAAVVADQPAGSLSVADICRAKRLDARAADSVEEIFHRHDELAYSGGPAAQEPVPAEERRGVLTTLETLEKR